MKYKIIEVDEKQHSVVVRFYTDKVTESDLATDVRGGEIVRGRTDFSIDLPVPPPQGADLDDFILARGPREWLETQAQVADPKIDTSMSEIKAMIGQEREASANRGPRLVSQPIFKVRT